MFWTRLILLVAVATAVIAGPVQTALGGVERQVEGASLSDVTTTPHRAVGFTTSPCGPAAVQVHNSNCGLTSLISDYSLLVREAERAGRSVQGSIDSLTGQLAQGNMNPGIGTRSLFNGISEARARDGARVYFRQGESGIEILSKSSKGNQGRVITRLMDLYG